MTTTGRGPRGEGYVSQGPDGRWTAHVPLPRLPGEKRARYTSRMCPKAVRTERQAGAWKRQMAHDLAAESRAREARVTDLTLAAYLDGWLADLPPDLSPLTVRVRRRATAVIAPALGHIRLRDLAPSDVRRWLNDLTVARSTANLYRSVLVTALQDAVRDRLIDHNPASLARKLREPAKARTVLDAGQARALIAAARAERLGALFVVAACLGLRRGELIGLTWGDVDPDGATLRVARQRVRVNGLGMVERPPKSGSARVILLPAMVVDALREHRDRQRFERQQAGWSDAGLVFPSGTGRPLSDKALYAALRRVIAAAGVPSVTPHELRHGALSLLLALGVEFPVAVAIAGHRSPRMLSEVYGHPLKEGFERAAKALDEALGGQG